MPFTLALVLSGVLISALIHWSHPFQYEQPVGRHSASTPEITSAQNAHESARTRTQRSYRRPNPPTSLKDDLDLSGQPQTDPAPSFSGAQYVEHQCLAEPETSRASVSIETIKLLMIWAYYQGLSDREI